MKKATNVNIKKEGSIDNIKIWKTTIKKIKQTKLSCELYY